MQHKQAQDIAERLVSLLEPGCELITIAGSLRREKPEVKDIEIVAVPSMRPVDSVDLFGTPEGKEVNELDERINELVRIGQLHFDPIVKRNGERYKRFMVSGIVLDLFIADNSNYGNTLAIRTGNADFSRLLVTPRRSGGLMPGNLKQADGYLWDGNNIVECPSEEAYFEALSIRWVEPMVRTAEVAVKLIRAVRA
jgi:DNA polymerase/3'-5' exonuclease PolX